MIINIKNRDTAAFEASEEISRSYCDVVEEAISTRECILRMVAWWTSCNDAENRGETECGRRRPTGQALTPTQRHPDVAIDHS